MSNKRAQIRSEIRNTRKNLSNNQKIIAAQSLKMNFIQHLKSEKTTNSKHIAIYLSNDGELDTSLLIKELWNLNHVVYLPIIHLSLIHI